MFDRKRSTTKRPPAFTPSLFSLAALVGCAVLGVQCGAPAACQGEACVSQARFALSPPGQPGPHKIARFDLAVPLAGGGSLTVTIAGPSEDGRELSRVGAPFPLVVLSPGFLLGRGQYDDYLERLASHGFVAVSQSARAEGNHAQYRDDTSKLLSWLIAPTGGSATRLTGRVDSSRIGLAGHSLGGKISLLTAAKDSRVKAVITVDPVDGQGMPLAKDSMAAIHLPPGIPIGFLGETISKSGAQPCAPAAFNYEVLYASTTAERFAIRFLKAAHADFVDKPASCFPCLFCPGGTAPKSQTHELAMKYLTAYFLYTLAGDAAAASYLTGPEVQKDVAAGDVAVQKS
jgi:dienelactone hydrolase